MTDKKELEPFTSYDGYSVNLSDDGKGVSFGCGEVVVTKKDLLVLAATVKNKTLVAKLRYYWRYSGKEFKDLTDEELKKLTAIRKLPALQVIKRVADSTNDRRDIDDLLDISAETYMRLTLTKTKCD